MSKNAYMHRYIYRCVNRGVRKRKTNSEKAEQGKTGRLSASQLEKRYLQSGYFSGYFNDF